MTRAFFDTNVLVYGVDNASPRKRDQSEILWRNTSGGYTPVLSTQILQEFFSAVTTKGLVEPARAKEIIKSWTNIETVIINPHHIEHAINLSILNRISFWDGLILAAAASARCKVLLTEDMNHGQTIAGVLIENPFL